MANLCLVEHGNPGEAPASKLGAGFAFHVMLFCLWRQADKRSVSVDNQQAKRVNEAAQKFAEAVRESYETVSGRSMEAQERSRMLTQSFFESVVSELETQAQSGQQVSEELMEQSRKQQEAFQQLSEESMNSYKEFMNTMMAYYQTNMERAKGNG
jgi:hypothetical protein